MAASDGGQPAMEAMEHVHKQPSQLNLEHNLKTSSHRSIYHKVHISVGVAFTRSSLAYHKAARLGHIQSPLASHHQTFAKN